MVTKWFKKAILTRPPNSLGGWTKTEPSSIRRSRAIRSRPKNWSLTRKRRSAGRALIALSNVNKDKETKRIARADAKYFFSKLKKK